MPTTQDYDEHDEPTNSPSYLNQNIDNVRLLYNVRDALKQTEIVALAAGGGASPATTVTGPDAYGASAVVGTGTTYARSDHDHGLPAAPAVPTASATVTGPDAYGASAAVGSAATFSRGDHDHGLPAAPADLPLAGGTMSGAIAMGTNKITGLGDGSATADAAAFHQIPTAGATVTGPDSYGASAAAGTATTWSKSDHNHGLPAASWPATVHPYTVSSNTITVAITYASVTITNNAAGSVAITLSTGAVDGQSLVVRFYDYTNAAQTLSWVNTENSTVSAPLTSNGSTTLPISAGFIFNGVTSRWRCMAAG
jgi:hypothetical protein